MQRTSVNATAKQTILDMIDASPEGYITRKAASDKLKSMGIGQAYQLNNAIVQLSLFAKGGALMRGKLTPRKVNTRWGRAPRSPYADVTWLEDVIAEGATLGAIVKRANDDHVTIARLVAAMAATGDDFKLLLVNDPTKTALPGKHQDTDETW